MIKNQEEEESKTNCWNVSNEKKKKKESSLFLAQFRLDVV